MGQLIEVHGEVVGDVALFDTDRSITGQDGAIFTEPPEQDGDLPAELARRIFAADTEVTSVYVASNGLAVRRRAAWEDGAMSAVVDVIAHFFEHYGPPAAQQEEAVPDATSASGEDGG